MPKFKFIKTYGECNDVYEVYMPDGNKFRYSWGQMTPFSTNKSTEQRRLESKENDYAR